MNLPPKKDGIYVHTARCRCEWCAEPVPIRYADIGRARGQARENGSENSEKATRAEPEGAS